MPAMTAAGINSKLGGVTEEARLGGSTDYLPTYMARVYMSG